MPAFASAPALSAHTVRFTALCPLRPAHVKRFSRTASQQVAACASAVDTQTTESAISKGGVAKDAASNRQHVLVSGAVVEYWSNGTLCLGTILEVTPSTVHLVDAAAPDGGQSKKTVSHGELISVWPEKTDASAALTGADSILEDADVGAAVRTLFAQRSRAPRAPFTSHEAAHILFPDAKDASAAAAAAARVLAGHTARFRRAGAGAGWRAYAPAVAATRETAAFVAAARKTLRASTDNRTPVWETEQRAVLADIEVCAASGAPPPRAVARVLRDLGYAATDDAAAALLLDLGHWARADDGKEVTRRTDAGVKKRRAASRAPEWTFPPAVLEEARKMRDGARTRRAGLADSDVVLPRKDMRSETEAVFCVDDRNTNFLDDAIAIKMLHGGALARVYVHVADVAGIVETDSEIDALARERGQSLYLPLRPLHMLPPPVMDAASFSTSLPTEAVTVCIDFDVREGTVIRWDVFPSLVPRVVRVNYEQLNDLLASQETSMPGLFSAQIARDLRLLAKLAPRLASVMDQRRTQRRANGSGTEAAISGVRLVRGEGETRVAQVSTFREGGSHAVVAHLLVAAGAVIREFARTRGVALPEDRGAMSYAIRCGTAPMRRYADLVTQRQLRCVLFGTQPAGRRAMEELRDWLVRRKDVAAKTVTGTRRIALFEALSDRCMRQARAAGRERAVLKGRVRNVTVSKRGVVRVLVALHGTGLAADARLSGEILRRVERVRNRRRSGGLNGTENSEGDGSGIVTGKIAKNETAQKTVREVVPAGTEVRVQIDKVDTAAQFVAGTVTSILV